jgi:multiple RNA-binding domain-containing protein 1
MALVSFVEPSEARKAFTGLAYRRYHHVPLYLEWAPIQAVHSLKPTPTTAARSSPKEAAGKNERTEGGGAREKGEDEEGGDYSTLFIKNLNFSTTEADLMNHLTSKLAINQGQIRTVSVPKKRKGEVELSMGFGFVEFTSSSGASKMLPRINSSALDGHILEVKPSDKRLSVAPSSALTPSQTSGGDEANRSSKLMVRNVAFQATKEELKSLFGAFGAVKRLRIPRKIGGVHRGFAFVDFNSHQEAAAAMAALSRTHMYGRHLVVEYAKEEEEDGEKAVGLLREKAKQSLRSIQTAASRKKRKVGDILDGIGDEGGEGLMGI